MSTTISSGARVARRRFGRRRRWSPADKAASLAAFATSGRSIKAFCAETGVARSTFELWQRKARAARTPRDGSAFARVEVTPPSTSGIGLVIRGRSGLEAELTGLDRASVVTVLRVVLRAGAAR